MSAGLDSASVASPNGHVELQEVPSKPKLPLQDDVMQLARLGDIKAIQKLFDDKKYSATYADEQGITPLHWAAINNHYALCHFLITAGADVNAKGGDAMAPPVLWACKKCNYYIVHLLLEHGADPLMTDDQGFNLLHSATLDGNVFQVVLLLHHPDISVDVPDAQGHTSLMWAAYKGYGALIDVLARWGANVYARDSQGFTALHWALVKGAQHGIFRLVEYGSDRFAENNEGKTPAITAKEMNAVKQWQSALKECGYKTDGSPLNFPLSSVVKDKRSFYWKLYFCLPSFNLFCMFYTMSLFPVFIGFPLGAAVGYGLNYVCNKPLKWAPINMQSMTKTPFVSGVFAGTLLLVGLLWIFRVLPATFSTVPMLNLIFGGFFGMTTFFYFKTMVENPGFIPKGSSRSNQKRVIDELVELREFDEDHFCVTCMTRRPLRSKHCRKCDRCVARQDHHCPWVDNCVAVNNHRHFLLYIVSMAFGIFAWDALFLNYLAIIPRPSDVHCAIISDEICATVSSDWYAVIISIWATLQLVWVSMLIIVQLLQIARGLTTYEAMTPPRHKHAHAQPTGLIVDAQDPTISAGPNNRGPAGGADAAGSHAGHAHAHKKGGLLHSWKQLLGIDTFVEVALHGRGAPAQVGGSGRQETSRNPFSRGCVTNCKDFWLDEDAPWFGSRESGRATFSGQRVDYTNMYEVPAGGMHYAPVSSGDGEV